VDTTAPDTTITAGPANASTSGPSVSFSFSSDEMGTFECQLDSASFASCASPQAYTGLSDGSHTFSVRGVDQAGNTDATPDSRTWTVDATGPVTTISSPTSGSTTGPSVSVTFSVNETATFQCKRDGGGYAACTSPQAYSGLSSGSHTVSVQGTDSYGNTGAAASVTWTVDTTAPSTTITSSPSNPSSSSSASFSFTSSESGSTFECKLDAAAFASCSSPQAYSGLSDGSHTFSVRATDTYGNTDTSPATYTWTVNTTAPPAPAITSSPTNPTNQTTASFSFNDTEAGVTFQCSLDSSAYAACTSSKSYSGLTAGSHTFAVQAKDAAGNLSPATSYTWTVDTTAPDTVIDSGPTSPTNSTSASFTFHSTETGSTFECKFDTGGFVTCTSPKTYTGLTSATHTVQVRAKDLAGNTDATPATFTWVVDTTPPNTTISSHPTSPSNSNSASFGFAGTDNISLPANLTFECQLDVGSFSGCTSPASYSGLADGSHTFQVRATDQVGNTDATPASFTWVVNATAPPAPAITSNPPNPSKSSSATFSFTDTEAGVTFQCSMDGAAYAACTSSKSYSGLTAGSHTFAVKAKDAAGNLSPATSYTWTVDTTAPPTSTITSSPTNPTNQTAASFSFTDTEAGVSFQCKLDLGSYVSCTSPQSYAGPLSTGSHTFAVTAKDAAGNTSSPASYTWKIDTTAPTATINQASGQPDPTSVSPIKFTVVFSESVADFATGDVTLSGTAGPTTATVSGSGTTYNVVVSGMTSNNGTVIASLAAGVAHDAAGNVNSASTSTDNTVTVTAPSAPSITSFSPTGGAVGVTVTINGSNFTGATAVTFNGASATFTVNTSIKITATVPAGATTGLIRVMTPAGTATSASNFTLAPLITNFTPMSGTVGASVVITGTTFTGTTSVKFNGTSALFTLNSDTQLTTTVPAGATTGPISVTTPAGTATSASNFTVAPRVTTFTPTSGPVGTSVTINGANFTGATAVTFNGVSATFTVNTSIKITATVPAGATTGLIRVTTPAGTGTSAGNFTVKPGITSFTPTSGAVSISVTITGTTFTGTTSVKFNGTSAVFTFSSDTQLTTTVPAGATTGPISVTTPAGTATSASNFTVAPRITSFTPTSGLVGTSVTINGSNFTGATGVTFSGFSATFTVNTSIKITATVPAGATTGLISVTTPAGTGTSTSTFTVTPLITNFTPMSGGVGTSVTITGTTFTGTTSVKFNGTSASFTFISDSQITATVPAGATSGPISISTPAGTATSATIFFVTPGTIGIDATVSLDGSGTMTTPPFSTSTAGDLLIAFVAYDGPSSSPQTASVSGAGLSWTLVQRSNSQAGTAEIWAANATDSLSAVTVVSQSGTGTTYHGSLTVIAFTNASGVGITGQAGARSGAPDVSLPGVSAGNWVFAVGNDWDHAIARSPMSGQVLVHQRVDTQAADTYWVQSTAAPSTSGGLVDIHDNSPTTDRWNYAAVEIVATQP
jgi:hypothetical protein